MDASRHDLLQTGLIPTNLLTFVGVASEQLRLKPHSKYEEIREREKSSSLDMSR
jgi:hypothetical protein